MQGSQHKQPIFCIGTVTLDLISLLPAYPKANDRVLAQEMVLAGGGPAATAAVTLSRLGHSVEMVTAIGDDDQGKIVRAELAREGVGTSHVKVIKNARTATSQVIVNSEKAERLIIHKPGALVEDSLLEFEFEFNSTWIHLDTRGYEALSITGKRESAFKNHQISLDGGNHIADINFVNLDLYVPTISELQNLYGASLSNHDLLIQARKAGASMIIATDGSNGSFSLNSDELIHAPAFKGDILSTLGAGDVFHGALLSEIINKTELSLAMMKANLCAFISCSALDGRSGVPSQQDLNDLFGLQQKSGSINNG